MEMDEAREGIDWHEEGGDVPTWALMTAYSGFLLLLITVFLLILNLQ